MRKALAFLLVAALAACTNQSAMSGVPQAAAAPSSGAGTSVMSVQVRQMFESRAVFPRTPVSTPITPITLADSLYRFAGGPSGMATPWLNAWEIHMSPLVVLDQRLQDLPKPLNVMTAPSPDKVPCRRAPLAGQDLTRPYVCPMAQKDAEQAPYQYILVMPAAFDQLLKSVTAQQGQGVEAAWRVAAIGAAVAHARYLRLVYKPFIGWPDSDAADYCVAGISNRVVFAPGKLLDQDMSAAVSAVDTVFGDADETRQQRMIAFMDGYNTGQLAHCVGY